MQTIIPFEHEISTGLPSLEFINKTGNTNLIIKPNFERAIEINKKYPRFKTCYNIYLGDKVLCNNRGNVFDIGNSKKIEIVNDIESGYYLVYEEDDETTNTYRINTKKYEVTNIDCDFLDITNGKVTRRVKTTMNSWCGTCNDDY